MTPLTFLAQASETSASIEGMPLWFKAAMGPAGAFVITLAVLIIYARRTENIRIPKLSSLLEMAQAKLEQAEKDKDAEIARLRQGYENRESVLQKRLSKWIARHSREKTRRIFFQTEASAMARRHDEKPPELPSEIGATSYHHRPLPPDPEPDDFKDETELPPVP